MPIAALLLALPLLAEPLEGARYRLHSDAPAEESAEFLRVLEAAYDGYRAFFGAEPALPKGEKLVVRFLETREEWAKAILADRAVPPAGAGGYYWPPAKCAYLYRQPTRYFTRVLLLHEAGHQFHYLARTANREPQAGWYREGLVEYLSWHTWDGERLALGVLPLVSLEDYPAAALAAMRGGGFDLGKLVSEETHADRPVAWALVRYLATGGKEGGPLPRFETLRRKLDAGGKPRPVFEAQVGLPRSVQPKLIEWVAAAQQPFVPIFNEWEGIAPGRLRGRAGVVSACRLRNGAARIAATLEPPAEGAWRGGLLLHHGGPADFTVAMVDGNGLLTVDRRGGEGWQRLFERPDLPRAAGGLRFEALREGGRRMLRVGGLDCGAYELPGEALGVALDGCELTFGAVEWGQ